MYDIHNEDGVFLIFPKNGREFIVDLYPEEINNIFRADGASIVLTARVREVREYEEDRAYKDLQVRNRQLRDDIVDLHTQVRTLKKLLINHREQLLEGVSQTIKDIIPF